MREFLNHAVLLMSDSTMAVSSKYTKDLSVQIVFFTFSCKWFPCFYFWAVIWSYIVDLFAALHELASASTRTLLKLASSVRTLLKTLWRHLKCDTNRCDLCKNFPLQASKFKSLATGRHYSIRQTLSCSSNVIYLATCCTL